MFVRITDLDDPKWVEFFTVQLIGTHGAKPTSTPHVFETPDDFPWRDFFGVERVPAPADENAMAAEIEWLRSYGGTFPFYLDLKRQFEAKGGLSEKQWAAITRAVERECTPRKSTTWGNDREFTYKAGDILLLKRWGAKVLAQNAGVVRPHFVVEVLETLAETPKAVRLRLRLSAQRTSHCGICGIALTNPHSVDAGIGPICAGRAGVSYGEKSLDELAEQLREVGEVETWLPAGAIKEKLN